ncbi:helix-turn-helix domain-containing protein [Corallococcus sp. AS-1-6]|uniref:helix-turn-helix domain-containing protein n=1 Tax=Corallococcus sp. AS-1-6 TaxID=2874599 RepID=UPI001CBFAB70|nr:helix-turn-helix domain-containing protein [Corallococcus sp. AS-1-6]
MAVAKVASGQSRAQAARQPLCATSTVVSAVQRFQRSGREGLLDGRAQNGQRKVDERFRRTLCRVLEGTPQAVRLAAHDVNARVAGSRGGEARPGTRLARDDGTRTGLDGSPEKASASRGALPSAGAPTPMAPLAVEMPCGLRPARRARIFRG